MIVYQCDLCGSLLDNRGKTFNLHISYGGRSQVNLIRDGQYEICGNCTDKLEKMLNEKEKRCFACITAIKEDHKNA